MDVTQGGSVRFEPDKGLVNALNGKTEVRQAGSTSGDSASSVEDTIEVKGKSRHRPESRATHKKAHARPKTPAKTSSRRAERKQSEPEKDSTGQMDLPFEKAPGKPDAVQMDLPFKDAPGLSMNTKTGTITCLDTPGVSPPPAGDASANEKKKAMDLPASPARAAAVLLKDSSVEVKSNTVNPVNALADCIEWIGDRKKKEFVIAALAAAQSNFYTAPASYSGKYHASESLGDGGLIRHTRKTALCALELASAAHLSAVEKDDLIAAAVIHDICKGGIPWQEYAPDHGTIAEQWLKNFDSEDRFSQIRHLVGMHMGEHNSPVPTPPETYLEQLICEADMLGSSRVLSSDNLAWKTREIAVPPAAASAEQDEKIIRLETISDCLEQIKNPSIKKYVRAMFTGVSIQNLTEKLRNRFLFAMELCRIENVNEPVRDQVLASIVLSPVEKKIVKTYQRYEDPAISQLRILIRNPEEFYPHDAARIVRKSEDLARISGEVVDKYVHKYDQKLEDSDLPRIAPKVDFRKLNEVEHDLAELREISQQLRDDPGLKNSDKNLREAAKRIKDVHKLLHAHAARKGLSPEISLQLEGAHNVMMNIDAAKKRIKDTLYQMREERLKQLAGDSIDPIVMSFFKATPALPPRELKETIDRLQEIKTPGSGAVIEGNKVQTLHREEVWRMKMNLLDEAIKNPVQNGAPVEIDVEYFELSSSEMIDRLRAALMVGCKVRVVMDPGHLLSMKSGKFDVSAVASRIKTILTLVKGTEEENLGVGLFPAKDFLGSKDELMHRKLFRVGEKVLLTGMNANPGSGENIDSGHLIEGPAARRLVEIYKKDVATTKSSDLNAIYGEQVLSIIKDGRYVNKSKETVEATRVMNPKGIKDLIDIANLLLELGLHSTNMTESDIEKLAENLSIRGYNLAELGEFYDLDGDGTISNRDIVQFFSGNTVSEVKLTDKGGELLYALLDLAAYALESKVNRNNLEEVALPEGAVAGSSRMVFGDSPVEREALMLHAIQEAEEFIYIPTFVMTESVARALVEKKNQMKARGRDIDIRVVIDSGLYQYGGTPNERGYMALEEAGIPVKWSLMWRTSSTHARKIHAKEMLTDKMEVSGSMNFSVKGMRGNWELSGGLYFDDSPESREMKKNARADFLETWNMESIDINTQALADKKFEGWKSSDVEVRKKEFRRGLLMKFLREIENFEKQIGLKMEEIRQDPEIQKIANELMATGMNEGYAYMKAVFSRLTPEEIVTIEESMTSKQNLRSLRSGNV